MTSVLIVDDSMLMRRMIGGLLESDPSIKVVGTATNGAEAVEKVKELKPDVVTLDVEMPVMDGITALPKILAAANPPPAVVMVSSLTAAGSDVAIKALGLGASEVLAKDGSRHIADPEQMKRQLVGTVLGVARGSARRSFARPAATGAPAEPEATPPKFDRPTAERAAEAIASLHPQAVVIASSTGGPPVLEKLLAELPLGGKIPVVIAQHMPSVFTRTLATRLDEQCRVPVRLGARGDRLEPGTVYLSEGSFETRITRVGGVRVLDVRDPSPESHYAPSADVLFASAADAFGARVLGVVVTGMGSDGLIGSKAIRAKGGVVIGQDEATSVVWGMPRAVSDERVAIGSFPPPVLGQLIRGAFLGEPAAIGAIARPGSGGMRLSA